MDIMTIIFWLVSLVGLAYAQKIDKPGLVRAIKKSKNKMGSLMVEIIAIIFLIGLGLAWVPPDTIERVLGGANQTLGTVTAALVGSITLIPAFVAFPLVGALVDHGAHLTVAAAFLTTLTMVGVMTFPIEKKTFGTKYAVIRNVISFIIALGIAWGIGGVLS